MRSIRGVITLPLVLLVGCVGATSSERSASSRGSSSSMIGIEELRESGQYSNLYDLIEVLRPRWLRSQGPDTFQGPQGQVQVHMDGNRLGDVDVLRSLSASGVTSIEWLGPIAAAGRFGLDHSHGAIIISTRPVH